MDALVYLKRYGYTFSQCANGNFGCMNHRLNLRSILKDFQKQFKLPITGKLDIATKQLMNQPRCGIRDRQSSSVKVTDLRADQKWNKRNLTWSFSGNDETYSYWIEQAFEKWKQILPQFTFQHVCSTCDADIILSFQSSFHNHEIHELDCQFNSNVLAHGFPPKDGTIHFNNRYKWTHSFENLKNSYNFYLTVVHQIGHALGYFYKNNPHNLDDKSSIMYPIYSNQDQNDLFTEADKQAMRNIYSDVVHGNKYQANLKWKQNAQTIAGGNGDGDELNQLYHPHGIYVDQQQQSIYIADQYNHRIVKWKLGENEGQIVAGGNDEGNEIDQLHKPTDVIADENNKSLIICDFGNRRVVRWSLENPNDKQIIIENISCSRLMMNENGDLFVADWEKHEVKRWRKGEIGGEEEEEGTIVAGGNGEGDKLNQLYRPTFLFIDREETVYVSDCDNHRVMKWLKGAREGIVVAGGQGQGNSLNQLSYPNGLRVNEVGDVYVADMGNDRIMCWSLGSKEGRIVAGENDEEEESNQLNSPYGLSFDIENNLYVANWGNHRIQRFSVDEN